MYDLSEIVGTLERIRNLREMFGRAAVVTFKPPPQVLDPVEIEKFAEALNVALALLVKECQDRI